LAGLFSSLGQGGISVVELAGPQAIVLLDPLFRNPRGRRLLDARPGRLFYGWLYRDKTPLDEVIVECAALRPWPRLLINCHGGYVAARRVLDALVAGGAREADVPERLALRFAAGELDAVQCEAAARLPGAATLRVARMLLDQFRGALAGTVGEIRRLLDGGPRGPTDAAARLEALLRTASYGRGLLEPPRVVLTGRPNVGKSTLANALLRYERVIVHPTPGTTRDVVEDLFAIRGVPFRLADTAGLRAAKDAVEREGLALGRRALTRARLALLVFDGSEPAKPEDDLVLSLPRPERVVPVINKSDLVARFPTERIRERLGATPVRVSALKGTGLAELEARILRELHPEMPPAGTAVIFTERQELLVRAAAESAHGGETDRAAKALEQLLRGPLEVRGVTGR